MNYANYITLLRILLTPLTLLILFSDLPYREWMTALLILFAYFTDWLDGYLARRNSVSKFGSYLDLSADKIYVLCLLFGLAQVELLPFWMACTILIRDLLINALRGFASAEGVIVSARMWGKLKTLFTFPAAAGLVIGVPGAYYLMLGAVLFSVLSGLLYLYDNQQLLIKGWYSDLEERKEETGSHGNKNKEEFNAKTNQFTKKRFKNYS